MSICDLPAAGQFPDGIPQTAFYLGVTPQKGKQAQREQPSRNAYLPISGKPLTKAGWISFSTGPGVRIVTGGWSGSFRAANRTDGVGTSGVSGNRRSASLSGPRQIRRRCSPSRSRRAGTNWPVGAARHRRLPSSSGVERRRWSQNQPPPPPSRTTPAPTHHQCHFPIRPIEAGSGVIETALAKGWVIEMDYYTAGRDVRTHRVVEPYRLEWRDDVPYLVGFCHRAQAERIFRLDRICEIAGRPQKMEKGT